eukprot:3038502-Prymnesium_polylepis.1
MRPKFHGTQPRVDGYDHTAAAAAADLGLSTELASKLQGAAALPHANLYHDGWMHPHHKVVVNRRGCTPPKIVLFPHREVRIRVVPVVQVVERRPLPNRQRRRRARTHQGCVGHPSTSGRALSLRFWLRTT